LIQNAINSVDHSSHIYIQVCMCVHTNDAFVCWLAAAVVGDDGEVEIAVGDDVNQVSYERQLEKDEEGIWTRKQVNRLI
jgi:hypothetical protein